jgi:hypothetical protein
VKFFVRKRGLTSVQSLLHDYFGTFDGLAVSGSVRRGTVIRHCEVDDMAIDFYGAAFHLTELPMIEPHIGAAGMACLLVAAMMIMPGINRNLQSAALALNRGVV